MNAFLTEHWLVSGLSRSSRKWKHMHALFFEVCNLGIIKHSFHQWISQPKNKLDWKPCYEWLLLWLMRWRNPDLFHDFKIPSSCFQKSGNVFLLMLFPGWGRENCNLWKPCMGTADLDVRFTWLFHPHVVKSLHTWNVGGVRKISWNHRVHVAVTGNIAGTV